MSERYPALRTIALFGRIAALVTLAFSIAIAYFAGKIFSFWPGASPYRELLVVGIVVLGAIAAVVLLAVPERIKILLDIQENTQKTAQHLAWMLERSMSESPRD